MASLETSREEFKRSPLLAMPIAGTIAWTVIGVAGAYFPTMAAAWVLFIGTGSIFGLGIAVSRFTGEDLLGKRRPGNPFDRLFLSTVAMANLAWAIAIPFFQLERTSLPLSVGILSGMMWLPLSWIIEHWVGVFHAVTRTALLVLAWYLFPTQRFVALPVIIVGVYLVSIWALARRARALGQDPMASPAPV